MKSVRILIILFFILTPLVVFAGGSSEGTGGTTAATTNPLTPPPGNQESTVSPGDVRAGEEGMAQSQYDTQTGPDSGFSGDTASSAPDIVPGAVGNYDTGTANQATGVAGTESTTGTMGSGKPGAVLKTIGNNEIRFTDISGYNFGTGKVKDLVLTQDGTVQYIVVNMNNAEGDFLVPPEMVSLASANGGVTATFNFGTGGTGTMTQSQGSAQMGSSAASPEATFASSLLKYDVVGSDNQKIGKVDDVVFDLQSGKVAYLALSQGGILGVGKNLYAVSFDNAQLDPQNGKIMLNVSANDLKNAKGFDKANWPMQAEIGVQANLGAGAGVQGTAESTTSTTSTTVPMASDNTQPGNTTQPSVNNPQGQSQSSGTK